MTITSIGYGDISPVHFWEYFLCIISQFSGGLLWAFIIGSICGVASNLDPQETAFKQLYDNLNYMMEDQDLPQPVRLRIREYYRESRGERPAGRAQLLAKRGPTGQMQISAELVPIPDESRMRPDTSGCVRDASEF